MSQRYLRFMIAVRDRIHMTRDIALIWLGYGDFFRLLGAEKVGRVRDLVASAKNEAKPIFGGRFHRVSVLVAPLSTAFFTWAAACACMSRAPNPR